MNLDIAVSGSEPLACGTCKFWHKKVNVNNIRDIRGECRHGPPHVTTVPGPGGQTIQLSSYPSLPEAFPACSQHQASVAISS